jgi:dolichol-phosphate mannosyltransferase
LSKRFRVVCILPAFNEAGKIGRVVEKVKDSGEVDAIIVVDDRSTDDTREEALSAGAQVITHERNQGVGAGIRSGLHCGREHGYDIAVIMSGDDQHEPKELAAVLEPLRSGVADFVQGSRRIKGGGTVNGPLFREVMTRLYSLVFSVVTWHRVTDATNGFRAFFLNILDRPEFNVNQDWLNRYELEPYLLYKAVSSRNLRVVEIPITIYYHQESRQYTKMRPFRDWWRLSRPLLLLRLGLRR